MKTPIKLASTFIVPFLCVATSASAATITQVTDISDLDLSNVLTAVSFRPDATDDTLEVDGTVFIGVTGFTTPKMGVTNTSEFVTTISGNTGTAPVISGGSSFEGLQLGYVYNSIAVGDQAISVAVPDGQYQVQLLLADGFIPFTTRIADITIEGKLTDDFSYAAAQLDNDMIGALLTENVVVTDGFINITLAQDGGIGGPHLSGMIISRISEQQEARITKINYFDAPLPRVEFTFNSIPNRAYRVEVSTSLLPEGQPGGWTELDDGFEALGTESVYTDSLQIVSGPRGFYRVTLLPLDPPN